MQISVHYAFHTYILHHHIPNGSSRENVTLATIARVMTLKTKIVYKTSLNPANNAPHLLTQINRMIPSHSKFSFTHYSIQNSSDPTNTNFRPAATQHPLSQSPANPIYIYINEKLPKIT
jgi:hypothetical protein